VESELKKDKPENGKVYRLTGGPDEPSIARGDKWSESVVLVEVEMPPWGGRKENKENKENKESE
jgi:hypothetical protein